MNHSASFITYSFISQEASSFFFPKIVYLQNNARILFMFITKYNYNCNKQNIKYNICLLQNNAFIPSERNLWDTLNYIFLVSIDSFINSHYYSFGSLSYSFLDIIEKLDVISSCLFNISVPGINDLSTSGGRDSIRITRVKK